MKIPLWLKIAWTAWLAVWIPCYWNGYGPQNFLWFCLIANFGIGIGLWLESPLIITSQAVSVLLVDALWTVDLIGAVFLDWHGIGGTEYMFNPVTPVWLRLLSLYHLVQPPLLLWGIAKLGYHPRGWWLQCAVAWVVLPMSYQFAPALDINWVWGPFDTPQHVIPPLAYLGVTMIAFPLLVYVPSHLVLSRIYRKRA